MFARALVPVCPKHTSWMFKENAEGTRREGRVKMKEALPCGGRASKCCSLLTVSIEMHRARYPTFKMNNLGWRLCTGLKRCSGILENRLKNHARASEAGLVSPVPP